MRALRVAVVVAGSFLVLSSSPALAGCVSRGTGDECVDKPQVNASPGEEISAKFLAEIDAADPLLAAALAGAITEELSHRGLVVKRYLLTGEHTGTIARRNGAGYWFTVRSEQIAQNAFSVAVEIEEDGTSRLSRYEGVILEKGRAGRLDRLGEKGRTRVVAWKSRNDRERERSN